MWVIIFMLSIVIPLIIWGFVAGWQEKQLEKKNDKTVLTD